MLVVERVEKGNGPGMSAHFRSLMVVNEIKEQFS